MNLAARKFSIISKEFEFLLKAGAALLGALFVLGLLITNIQLMSLGLSDFSSLRTRNVMIGFLFLFYVLLLGLVLFPISFTLRACFRVLIDSGKSPLRRVFGVVGRVMSGLVLAVCIGSLAGTLMGYLFPSGRRWTVALKDAWSWRFQVADTIRTLRQLHDVYWRPKTIVAGMLIIIFATIPLLRVFDLVINKLLSSFPRKEGSAKANGIAPLGNVGFLLKSLVGSIKELMASNFKWIWYLPLGFTLPLLLFDYADAVHPNLFYNLGGGQPRIVRLHVEKRDLSSYTLFDLQVSADDTARIIVTNPVVLWYQDEAFIYVSPVPFGVAGPTIEVAGPTKVIAVDSKAVYAVKYLHGHAKIGSGGQILDVSLANDAGP